MKRSRVAAVKSLQELYTVAVGVALVVAIERLFRHLGGEGVSIRWELIPAFIAFLATLIPFFHGALRHLDQRYIEESGRSVRDGALLADFLLLFLEACILLAIANALVDIGAVTTGLAALLLLDSVWGASIYLFFTRGRRRWAELDWVLLNLIAGPLFVLLLLYRSRLDPSDGVSLLTLAVPVAAVLRTTIDYARSWKVYFP